jgi:hypothetical protein
MQICKDHWNKLRTAIHDRCLDHLMSGTVAANMRNPVQKLLLGHPPLVVCTIMICQEALKGGGVYLLGMKEDGTAYCPICEALENNAGDENFWINGPADAVLEHARELNLVPTIQ